MSRHAFILADPLSPWEYVRLEGTRCPCCGELNIEGTNVYVDKGCATQAMRCLNCDVSWLDRYELVRYDLLSPEGG